MSIRDERKQQSRQALLDAALHLSTSGRSFSSISLREIARHVGLVPTAFYRHFQDMNELGLELVDQVALHLKGILHQLGQAYIYQPNTKTKISLDLFFQAVEHNPEPWVFLIAERWGGSEVIRHAIAREINFLIEDDSLVIKVIDQGIGFDKTKVDTVIEVSESEAKIMTKRLAKEEGIFAGMSSGGAVHAALELIKTLDKGVVVVIICDRGDRYLSSDLFY